jgi:hypothetical protein
MIKTHRTPDNLAGFGDPYALGEAFLCFTHGIIS